MNSLNWLLNSIIISSVLGDVFNSTSFDMDNSQVSDESTATGYVIGGQEARAFQYPYIVYLTDKRQSCGGSIIGRNVVITAAHCIGSQNPSDYDVFAHRHNLRTNPNNEQAVKLSVRQIITHPNYNGQTFENDIALLILNNDNPSAVPGGNMDNMIQLDTQGPREESTTKVIGWGITNTGQPSPILREADLKVVNGNNCARRFRAFNPDLMICIGPIRQGETACRGDSGGPLVTGSTLIGLVSHGSPSCDYPFSVYTKVSKYIDWINQSRQGGSRSPSSPNPGQPQQNQQNLWQQQRPQNQPQQPQQNWWQQQRPQFQQPQQNWWQQQRPQPQFQQPQQNWWQQPQRPQQNWWSRL